ncbi:hypothetical protein [Pedobacter sp. Leaf250]|uniref:response regulator n=1 Tax=Pedobacter sp. Leaf250 TaxID=2876559 RepID=UPI001E44CE24|nr:hypothetical protein [Pedobacter sp. Leaf250]
MLKVLLIENDLDVLNRMTRRLENSYQVLSFTNSREGKRHFIKFSPDIVIIATDSIEVDIYHICKDIKSDMQISNVKIIVTSTSFIQPELFERYCDAYMIKPFKIKNFLKIITDVQLKR